VPDGPRIVYEGPTGEARTRWRVVLTRQVDANGVLQEVRYIETADETDRDAMGQQRWRQLTMKSPQSAWETVCAAAISLALEKELANAEG